MSAIAVYRYLVPVMWLGWAVYWRASLRNVKRAVWHESLPSRLSYVVPLALAGLLLSVPNLPLTGSCASGAFSAGRGMAVCD